MVLIKTTKLALLVYLLSGCQSPAIQEDQAMTYEQRALKDLRQAEETDQVDEYEEFISKLDRLRYDDRTRLSEDQLIELLLSSDELKDEIENEFRRMFAGRTYAEIHELKKHIEKNFPAGLQRLQYERSVAPLFREAFYEPFRAGTFTYSFDPKGNQARFGVWLSNKKNREYLDIDMWFDYRLQEIAVKLGLSIEKAPPRFGMPHLSLSLETLLEDDRFMAQKQQCQHGHCSPIESPREYVAVGGKLTATLRLSALIDGVSYKDVSLTKSWKYSETDTFFGNASRQLNGWEYSEKLDKFQNIKRGARMHLSSILEYRMDNDIERFFRELSSLKQGNLE